MLQLASIETHFGAFAALGMEVPPEGVDDLSPYVAKFANGDMHEVPQKTWGDIKQLIRDKAHASRSVGGGGCLNEWVGTHTASKNQVRVAPRQDAHMLVSIFEQTK